MLCDILVVVGQSRQTGLATTKLFKSFLRLDFVLCRGFVLIILFIIIKYSYSYSLLSGLATDQSTDRAVCTDRVVETAPRDFVLAA